VGLTGLFLALVLPWLLGMAWLHLGWRNAQSGAWPMLLGYGYILGALATTGIMRLFNLLHIQFSFAVIALTLVSLTALGSWLGSGLVWRDWRSAFSSDDWQALPDWQKFVFTLLLGGVIVRLLGLGLEIVWRPLYPWDAWTQWTTKARVWYELGWLAPFVSADAWLNEAQPLAFTDAVPYYPGTVPLLQVWAAYGLGHWDDSVINLPWLLCAIALGLAFYGQTRALGVPPLGAMVFTYFLLSMPLLNAHVALAGYPDLFMAAIYGLAAMAFTQWARTRDVWQGVLALLLALSCVLIKRPGLIWMVTFLPALWVALMPRAGLFGVLGAGMAGIVMLKQGKVASLFFGYGIAREPQPVLEPLLWNLFAMDNWHLLWFLVLAVMALSLSKLFSREIRATTVLMLSGVTFLGVAFFYTDASKWVQDFTTVNRAVLHLAPAMLFYAVLLCHEMGWLKAALSPAKAPESR
jgi:hypothetical protein